MERDAVQLSLRTATKIKGICESQIYIKFVDSVLNLICGILMTRIIVGQCNHKKKIEKKIEYIAMPYKEYVPVPVMKESKPIVIQVKKPMKMMEQSYGHMGMDMSGIADMSMDSMGMDSIKMPVIDKSLDMLFKDMTAMGSKRSVTRVRPNQKSHKKKESDKSSDKKKLKLKDLVVKGLRVKRFSKNY